MFLTIYLLTIIIGLFYIQKKYNKLKTTFDSGIFEFDFLNSCLIILLLIPILNTLIVLYWLLPGNSK